MLWAAVPLDDDAGREQLMARIKVTSIPRLVVLDGKTGRISVDNAVGQPIMDMRLAASKKEACGSTDYCPVVVCTATRTIECL